MGCSIEFARQKTIEHVADATFEIDGPESITLDSEKQKANGSECPKCCDDVWQVFHFCVKFFNASVLCVVTVFWS
jgi:hypothetical protein